jgi:hypothetical protein
MAVTAGGYRLYFTHHRDGFRSFRFAPADEKPNTLELGHIRIPPKNEPAIGQMKPHYKLSYHYGGITMLCTPKTEMVDQVVMTTVTSPNGTTTQPSINGMTNPINSLVVSFVLMKRRGGKADGEAFYRVARLDPSWLRWTQW